MDGQIIIGTKLDTKQFDDDLDRIKRRLKSLDTETKTLVQAKLKIDFSDYEEELTKLRQSTKYMLSNAETEEEKKKILEEQSQKLSEINSKYAERINTYNEINNKIRENIEKQGELEESIDIINQKAQESLKIDSSLRPEELQMKLKEAAKMLDNFEKENEVLIKAKAKLDLSDYYSELDQLKAEHDATTAWVTDAETRQVLLNQENKQLEEINNKYAYQIHQYNLVNEKIRKNAEQQEFVAQKINEINSALNNTSSISLDSINRKLGSISSSITGVARKMVHWTLLLFGIRGAYTGIRRAISMVSADNEVVAAQLQQMRNVITNVLSPIVSSIVNLLAKIMVYINAIFRAFTGKNLFDFSSATKSGASNLASGAKSSGKMAKDLKEAKKQLAGFDEMEVLQDNASDAGGGGGAGGGAGGGVADIGNIFDQFKDLKIPWLEWLVANKDLILSVLAGIIAGLLGIKMGLTPLLAFGLATIIGGVVYAIQGLIDYLKDPSWKNFGKIIQGIGVAIAGLGVIIAVATGSWVVLIAGALVLIVGTIVKHWDQIKAFLQKGIDWLISKSEWVHKTFGDFIGGIYDGIILFLKLALNAVDSFFKKWKTYLDTVISLVKGAFSTNWKNVWNGVKDTVVNVFNKIKTTISSVFDFITNKSKNIGSAVGNAIVGGIKGLVNAALRTIENVVNTPIRAINTLISAINKMPGISMSKLSTFSLPRLAKGGIINQPSRGVPIGSAIAGESGAEGVIPLTDSQQMALLGEAIGRYITVNLTNVNSMNGRVISRELKKVNAQDDFASNR